MNDNQENNKLSVEAKMVRIACIMFVVAIIAICFAIARVEKTYIKILIYVLSAVPILLGALLCLAAGVSKYSQTHRRNYFLYDKKLKGDIPLEQLDFETVRSKMADYIDIFKHGGKIYVGELFEDKPYAPVKEMRPLICYELLYEIAEQGAEAEQYGEVFLGYGHECAQVFMTYLAVAGDYELGRALSEHMVAFEKGEKSALDFCLYLEGQAERIEQGMMTYIRKNTDKFIM